MSAAPSERVTTVDPPAVDSIAERIRSATTWRDDFDLLVDEQLGDAEFLRRVLVAVEGIGDGDGNAIAAEQQLAMVVDDLALGSACARAFVEHLAGAAAKNAKPSRAR